MVNCNDFDMGGLNNPRVIEYKGYLLGTKQSWLLCDINLFPHCSGRQYQAKPTRAIKRVRLVDILTSPCSRAGNKLK